LPSLQFREQPEGDGGLLLAAARLRRRLQEHHALCPGARRSSGTVSPTAQAIFQSYRIPAAWLQKKLAPHFSPPPAMAGSGGSANPGAAAAAINRSTAIGIAGANNSANCFNLSVLRETPTYDLPRSCGGSKPVKANLSSA